MDPLLIEQIGVAAGMGLIGAVVFAAIGLVSGTDETTTLAPLTLLVVLLGVPPAGVFTFFLAGAVAKHMTHAVPTALLGIPGDTLATPLLQDADMLRKLGVPHIALRKMVSGAIIAAFIAVPPLPPHRGPRRRWRCSRRSGRCCPPAPAAPPPPWGAGFP